MPENGFRRAIGIGSRPLHSGYRDVQFPKREPSTRLAARPPFEDSGDANGLRKNIRTQIFAFKHVSARGCRTDAGDRSSSPEVPGPQAVSVSEEGGAGEAARSRVRFGGLQQRQPVAEDPVLDRSRCDW